LVSNEVEKLKSKVKALEHEPKKRGIQLAEAAKRNIELTHGHAKLEAKMSAIEEAHEKETKLAQAGNKNKDMAEEEKKPAAEYRDESLLSLILLNSSVVILVMLWFIFVM
jgi:hypothetical protein